MSQLAVILDNLVKIFENVNDGGRKQAPTGEQQQISQEQHRNALLNDQNFFTAEAAESAGRSRIGFITSFRLSRRLGPTRSFSTYGLIRVLAR
jgi:hypothetical protein